MPVVVLDQQDPTVSGEDRPQFGRAPGTDRRSGRILRPVGDDDRPRTRPERRVEGVRQRAVVVDLDGDRAHAERRNEIQQATPAGILDRDRVTGPEVRDQHPFDRVQ